MRIVDNFGERVRTLRDNSWRTSGGWRIFPDGRKVNLNKKGEEKMSKVTMYACDGCGTQLKDKESVDKAVKVPGPDGKNKVMQLCEKCSPRFGKWVAEFFKEKK